MATLEEVLNNTQNIKLIYVIPTFQIPLEKHGVWKDEKKLAELSALL
mgnify:CR=1 FL=1